MTFNTTEHTRYLWTRRLYTYTESCSHYKKIYIGSKLTKRLNKYYKNSTNFANICPSLYNVFVSHIQGESSMRNLRQGKDRRLPFAFYFLIPYFPVYEEEIHQAFCLEDLAGVYLLLYESALVLTAKNIYIYI